MSKTKLKFWPCPGGLNVGYSWSGVLLLGASGRTGRFFTQLLFHNPHSHNIFLNMRVELKYCISHKIQLLSCCMTERTSL